MKKMLCSLFWCALVLSAPTGAVANLLENGSFDMFARGKFDGWHVPRTDGDGVFSHGTIIQDTTQDAAGGGASLALQFKGGETEGEEELVFRVRPAKPVPITPGKKHRITFQAKAKEGPFLVVVEPFTTDATKKKKDVKPVQFAAGQDWQAREIIVNAPAEGLFLGFQIKIVKAKGVAGTVWLDEFVIEEMPEP